MKPLGKSLGMTFGLLLPVALLPTAPAAAIDPPSLTVQCDGITLPDVIGPAPASARALATFPNDHAVCNARWVPRLDAGTVPQGLALVGDHTALVSGHVNSSRSTARVMRMDLATGAVLASRDIPKGGHGGGIEIDDDGGVWVASSNKLLYWPSITAAFSASYRRVRISTNAADVPFKASFVTSGSPGRLWIGSHQTTELLEFPTSLLVGAAGTARKLTRADALSVIDIASKPEGAAWGSTLLVSSSRSTCGVLRVSAARAGFGPGAQQIELDGEGRLWGIFQAGSARYPDAPYFPVIASFDISLLAQDPLNRCGKFGI